METQEKIIMILKNNSFENNTALYGAAGYF